MAKVDYSKLLKEEYQRLFDTCIIRENKNEEVENILSRIELNQDRYVAIENALGIPWYYIAVVHNMESSLNFNRHLHNGDSLTKRTVHDPAGHPKSGDPPFTWEESAVDALKLRRLDQWQDWSLPGVLYNLEGYNGWGYRLYHSHVLSPYLWSFSNQYSSGKYVADGRWSDTAVSKQAGAAVLLRRMVEKGAVEFIEPIEVGTEVPVPLIRYSSEEKSNQAEELQMFLNRLPGIYVKIDGYPGEKTSDAFKQVTGYYLQGDPRNES